MKTFRNPTRLLITGGLRDCLIACLAAGCAANDAGSQDAAGEPTTSTTSNALAARPGDPARTAAMVAKAAALVRPGSVVQAESRLGVPTFLWTRPSPAVALAARQAVAGTTSPEAAARGVLADYAPLYGLSDGDVAAAVVAHVDDRGSGPVLVKLRTEIGGIAIFGEELNVVMTRQLDGVALSGYLTSPATPAARSGGLGFGLAPTAGAATALGQLAGAAIDPALVVSAGARDGYQLFGVAPAAGIALDDLIRVKPVYFHLPDGLEAAYYVEVFARTGPAPLDVLAADGRSLATSEAYAYVVSATTGQPLFRKNLIAEARPTEQDLTLGAGGFTYRVWADPVTGIPSDTPAGNAVHPKLGPALDGFQATFVATSDVTLPNFPFSQNDPWLAPGATETDGNNADTFLNLFTPDGFDTAIAAPADPPTGDFRAQITAADNFLHAQTPDGNGARAEGRQGAIQQLFYDINFLHDWYYDAGFNEAAGNAQNNNFSRGGTGGDSIKGQIQDLGGFNNANMMTAADGARPRMRMYNFVAPANHLELQAPGAIAGNNAIGISMSGVQTVDVTTDIVRATFSRPCTVTNAAALAGKIAMFDFDNTDRVGCPVTTRITRLSAVSPAVAAIVVVYTSAAPTVVANLIGFNTTHTKPITTISWNTGQAIDAQLTLLATVTARLYRAPDRDGALDNQVVFHEWFHYVSNRLIGDGTGLGTNMSAGMGEGWSDFNAMLLTVRENDTATPSNANFDGTYALATYATSGVPFDGTANHGYYFGIRRYPYSTDLTRNPLSFRHISNGVMLPSGPPIAFGGSGINNAEVHNTGEVWATMLWECYAALLRDTLGTPARLTFQQAQDRMKQYLISALKVTPISPTFLDARDALLAVAFATDAADYLAFRLAFTKRGAGVHAVSPDRHSADNVGVVEDFSTDPDLSIVSVTLDDSFGSCDTDGVLDHGEYGKLSVTVRNIGTVALSAITATISTPTSTDVWYPLGNTLSFPPLAPGVSATASLRVAYLRSVADLLQLDFKVDCTAAELAAPQSKLAGFRTNTDDLPGSRTETVEPAAPPWTQAFGASLGNVAPWKRVEIDPLHHRWHVDDPNTGSDQSLVSPLMMVDGSGSLTIAFDHSYGFEFDGGGNYDGGVIEISQDGVTFTDLGTSATSGGYNGTILFYAGTVNPLNGRSGFVQSSVGVVHTVVTRAISPGTPVQIRLRSGSDSTIGATGWNIDEIAFAGIVEAPFSTVVADTDSCTTVPVSADLAITVTDGVGVVTAIAGSTLTYTITAVNLGADGIIGARVADAFPAGLTCTWTCAGSSGGGCTASGSGNIADLATLPVGGAATYTASCALPISTSATTLVNTATIAPPGPVTDVPSGNNSATDTDSVIHLPAHLFASKSVAGSFTESSTVTYTIVLSNDGTGPQSDNDSHEFVDVLPSGLALVDASATSGTAFATLGTKTVTWNGAIAAGETVAITIVATITATAGAAISNHGTFHYDSLGSGTNDASGTTEAYPCVLNLAQQAAPAPRSVR